MMVEKNQDESVQPDSQATPCLPAERVAQLEEHIVEMLKTVYDPEIPVDIYELGLVYDIEVSPEGAAAIQMTLTSPACPVAGSLPEEVRSRVNGIPGIEEVRVDLVWDPPWSPERMSEAAKLQLGFL
jgi:FeS assembly SUF system protein